MCVNQNIKVFGNFQMEIFPLFASVKSFKNLVFGSTLVMEQLLQFSRSWKIWISYPPVKAF